MDDPITFGHERMVHLDRTYHWVSLKSFRINADRPAIDLLTVLIRHPQYRDNYAGGGPDDPTTPALHGPYLLDRITPDSFDSLAPRSAQISLQQWASRAGGTVSAIVQAELTRWVYAPLAVSEVFQLPNLRPEAEHD